MPRGADIGLHLTRLFGRVAGNLPFRIVVGTRRHWPDSGPIGTFHRSITAGKTHGALERLTDRNQPRRDQFPRSGSGAAPSTGAGEDQRGFTYPRESPT